MRGSNPEKGSQGGHGEIELTREKHKHILSCPTVLWGPEAKGV